MAIKTWTDKYRIGDRVIFEDEEATVAEVGSYIVTVILDRDNTYQIASDKDDLKKIKLPKRFLNK